MSAGFLSLGHLEAALPGTRPNIVYILCDDLGYGDVQALNPEHCKIATPHINRLAAEGMTFTDCHSSSAVCSPSRYSILTGRYSWRSRLQSGVIGGEGGPLLAPDRLTVGTFLKQQGYVTAALGKWHLGLQFDKADYTKPITDGPLQHGFDYFFGISASLDMPPYVFIENDRFTEVPSVKKKFPSFMYGTNAVPGPVRLGPAGPGFEAVDVLPKLTQKAVEYIRQRGEDKQPFFLYLPLPSPHTPVVPTPEWQGKSSIGPYGDYVMETDWTVGEVMKSVDEAGLGGNTIIIFTSDNGCAPYVGTDKLEATGHFPSASFRGYKSDIWEGGHRIPFLVRWPGRIESGSRCSQIACQSDLLATCADLLQAGLPDNAGEDSVSLLPLLLGRDQKQVREAIVNHSNPGRFAIRTASWKLELCPGSGGWGEPGDAEAFNQGLPPIQLYNMHEDAGERVNLEGENAGIVTNLLQLLQGYVANGRSTPGAPQTNDVPVDIFKRHLDRPKADRSAVQKPAPPAQLVYKTVGERKLTLDVDYPPGWKETDQRPAIVFFFGGGWRNGSPEQFKPQAEYFARRGLVCLRADYRVRSRDGVLPDKCVEDALSALCWVRSHAAQLGIDRSRIVASGGSAGGHLAACTFFVEGISGSDAEPSVSPKPNALLLYNPVVDLTVLQPTDDARVAGGLDGAVLRQISPSLHACKEAPPTLIIDGTADRFYSQIREFVQKSQALGAPVEASFTEGQPHGFFNRSPWLEKTTEEADAFLCRIGYLDVDPKVSLPSQPRPQKRNAGGED